MTLDLLLFLLTVGGYSVILLSLTTLFTVIIFAWIFLFAISIRSHIHTPLIIRKMHHLTKQPSNNLPLVSVTVPARNEQENIERCLLSLLAQDYPSFEVIVVNDSSTDNTLEIVKKIKRSNIRQSGGAKSLIKDRLKIITVAEKPEKWTGKSWASEQGYLHSIGNILLFTDDETVAYMQSQALDVLTGISLSNLETVGQELRCRYGTIFQFS